LIRKRWQLLIVERVSAADQHGLAVLLLIVTAHCMSFLVATFTD
jgi:hypothetical protein